ncbi:uncharacterized protein [Fopius arisanus]|uniref:Spz_1 protein n=2 Tax=Fopius arisanus TaxID=64838 RepID=A0A0C9R0L3_9HYME|nr:PREDICTED: uncharacterized protein LOC105273159 [Fopius arisanus]XP_011313732.1 PREDICTED: uncharacterized protein LOC105273159 [Fopius arisanus]
MRMERRIWQTAAIVLSFLVFLMTQRVECYPPEWRRYQSPKNNTWRIPQVMPSSGIASDLESDDVVGSEPRDKGQGSPPGAGENEEIDEETERLLEEAFRLSPEEPDEPGDQSPIDEMQLRRYDFKRGRRPGGVIPSKLGDEIIFPDHGKLSKLNNYGRVPICRRGTFCEDVPFYPTDLINRIVRSDVNLKYLQIRDELEPTISLRTSGQDEVLCESKKHVIRPRAAQNRNYEWRYIANTDNFTQSIGVEICENDNSACKLVDGFASGYKTMCKQNFIYRELVAVVSGKLTRELFQIPTSCCCQIQFIGDPSLRMGVNLEKSDT